MPWEISLEDHGITTAPENPVPITAAPADEDDDQSLGSSVLAFDIKTTSQVCSSVCAANGMLALPLGCIVIVVGACGAGGRPTFARRSCQKSSIATTATTHDASEDGVRCSQSVVYH